MKRWTPGRLRAAGYVLGTIGAVLVVVVAVSHPRSGPALLGVAVLLVLAGAGMIGLAQMRGGRA